MSASALTAAFGSGEVRLDPTVRSVRHRDRPGLDYLDRDPAPASVVLAGRRLGWRRTGSSLDPDEVETHFRVDDRGTSADPVAVELSVRHTFALTWAQRYVLTNPGDAPVRLDEFEVAFAPGRGCLGWGLAAGAEAFWCLQPVDGAGPLLVATLQFGEIAGWVPDDPAPRPSTGVPGWRTGAITLPPGGRYVLHWIADWYPSVAEFRRRRASLLPDPTELTWPQPADVAAADAALVTDPGLVAAQDGGRVVLSAERPGRYGIELRGPRGTVRSALTWVETVEQAVARASEILLSGPRTSAGVVRLPDSAAALVVQQALADRSCDRPDLATEALDRMTAGLLGEMDPDGTDPGDTAPGGSAAERLGVLDLAFLAGESLRTGDVDCAAAARAGVLGRTRPEPGLGLAATALSVAELAAGLSIGPIVQHLGSLLDPPPDLPSTHWSATTSGGVDDGSRLELALIVRRPDVVASDSVSAGAVALGAAVGSGLPGTSLRPTGITDAYAAAVLQLVPDELAAALESGWSFSPHLLAERLRRRALARRPDVAEVSLLAWLVLSQPPG